MRLDEIKDKNRSNNNGVDNNNNNNIKNKNKNKKVTSITNKATMRQKNWNG